MDVPVHEEGTADDEVIMFTDVNDSFSIVCDVTYSMLSHYSVSVIVVASYPCIKVSRQEKTSCSGTSSTVICS